MFVVSGDFIIRLNYLPVSIMAHGWHWLNGFQRIFSF